MSTLTKKVKTRKAPNWVYHTDGNPDEVIMGVGLTVGYERGTSFGTAIKTTGYQRKTIGLVDLDGLYSIPSVTGYLTAKGVQRALKAIKAQFPKSGTIQVSRVTVRKGGTNLFRDVTLEPVPLRAVK